MSTISSVITDKPLYTPGQTITVTASGSWEQVDTITVTTPDGATGSGSITVVEPITATDSAGRVWTLVSNTGTQAVFTAVA